MKKHSAIIDFLLTIVTFGIWEIIVNYKFFKEVHEMDKLSVKPTTALILMIFFPIVMPFIAYQAISKLESFVSSKGGKPKMSALNWLLSIILGAFTLGIWPLITYFQKYNLWNQALELLSGNQTEVLEEVKPEEQTTEEQSEVQEETQM